MLDDDAQYQCQVSPGPNGIKKKKFVLFRWNSNFLFFCVFFPGEPGIRSDFAKLIVLVPPEPARIIQGDYLVTTEDREIELECISSGGKPAPEVCKI